MSLSCSQQPKCHISFLSQVPHFPTSISNILTWAGSGVRQLPHPHQLSQPWTQTACLDPWVTQSHWGWTKPPGQQGTALLGTTVGTPPGFGGKNSWIGNVTEISFQKRCLFSIIILNNPEFMLLWGPCLPLFMAKYLQLCYFSHFSSRTEM